MYFISNLVLFHVIFRYFMDHFYVFHDKFCLILRLILCNFYVFYLSFFSSFNVSFLYILFLILSYFMSHLDVQVHLNKLECRGKVHLFQ